MATKMIFKFSTLALAEGFRDHAEKAMVILHGDDRRYWVVSLADSAKLEQDGFEVVG